MFGLKYTNHKDWQVLEATTATTLSLHEPLVHDCPLRTGPEEEQWVFVSVQ